MKDRFEKVIYALKFWNLKLKPGENYEDRFKIQKLVYLCDSLGMKMDYPFSIYVHGPYSSPLADEYYSNSVQLENLETEYEPPESEIQILNKIKEIILEKSVKGNREMEFMEAVATIQFLKEEKPKRTEDDIYVKTKELKPHLNEYLITIALNVVKQLRFKPEFLTDKIKEELELWDAIDDDLDSID